MFAKEIILEMLHEDKKRITYWQEMLENAENDLSIIHAERGLQKALCTSYAHKEMLTACGFDVEYKDGVAVDVYGYV